LVVCVGHHRGGGHRSSPLRASDS